MNKQIEEMAKCCPYYHNGECCEDATAIRDCDLMCEMFGVFSNLDKENYRKQSEDEWLSTTNITISERGRRINSTLYVCSACRKSNGRHKTNYCPNCGAKMKGGE